MHRIASEAAHRFLRTKSLAMRLPTRYLVDYKSVKF